MMRKPRSWVPMLAVLPVLAAGCALSPREDPTVFLVLAPVDRAAPPDAARASLRVGVGPVILPRYLDRPQLVSRTSPTELRIHEHARWAAPLGELISEAVGEELHTRLGLGEVVRHPWPSASPPDLSIRISVQQLETVLPDSAVLRARWEMVDAAGTRLGHARSVDYRIPASGSPGAAALELGRLVTRLATEIAEVLRAESTTP